MAVVDNILAYMNARGNKQYTKYQVGAIRTAVRIEFITRDKSDIFFNARSKVGKEKLNKKIAEIANNTFKSPSTFPCSILIFICYTLFIYPNIMCCYLIAT